MKKTLLGTLLIIGLSAGSAAGAEITLDTHDVQATRDKIQMALQYFDGVWQEIFHNAGRQFVRPRVVAFTGTISTGCSQRSTGPAFYCRPDNTIYFDVVMLAKLMKLAANQLGTDGDYAPIVILAHELGHAVAFHVGAIDSLSIRRENLADCLAGVVTRHAAQSGTLERGDLEEALFAFELGGDPATISVYSDQAHGSSEIRINQFMAGYRSGLQACSALSARLSTPEAPRRTSSAAAPLWPVR